MERFAQLGKSCAPFARGDWNAALQRCFENGNDDFGVEAFWIGVAARVGYFVPLNGPLNGHPPSWLLFKKLLDRNTPLHIVRLLVCWYSSEH